MNFWLFVVLLIIVISYLLELIVSLLNIGALDPDSTKRICYHI